MDEEGKAEDGSERERICLGLALLSVDVECFQGPRSGQKSLPCNYLLPLA